MAKARSALEFWQAMQAADLAIKVLSGHTPPSAHGDANALLAVSLKSLLIHAGVGPEG